MNLPADSTKSLKWRRRVLILALILGCVVFFLYLSQPDWLVPVTMVPPWLWIVPASVVLWLGWWKELRIEWRLLAACTLLFVVSYVEEFRSMTRLRSQPARDWRNDEDTSLNTIRVVSINCNGGNGRCLDEALAYEPDIILLQESPSSEKVAEFAKLAFGEEGNSLWNGDTSIVARGSIRAVHSQRGAPFVCGLVSLSRERNIAVVSLRLSAPAQRLDFWSRHFWVAYKDMRQNHRKQLKDMLAKLDQDKFATRWVIGGDFNSLAGDGAMSPLRERLRDSFRDAGTGWGGTGTNDMPLFRVDQIWTSQNILPMVVTSRRSQFSDHRLVVADFFVE